MWLGRLGAARRETRADDKRPEAGYVPAPAHVRADHERVCAMPPAEPAIGLDFGTTNTVLARALPGGAVEAQMFRHDNQAFSAFRSVLALWQEQDDAGLSTRTEAGPWAIERFIADPLDCRILQSFKTFAASHAFRSTTIAGRAYTFEDLLTAFFRKFCEHAGTPAESLPKRLILGRPVAFAGANPDEALAAQRYEAAFRPFGFTEIHHVYEPVAAAFFYAQRLTRDATVLVADFGGGTSDFSLVHFSRDAKGIAATPLAQSGVGVAGDTFDYRIIDAIVSPRLGKGTKYRSWGKVLDVPGHYYANFARWNQLSIMKSRKILTELGELARSSLEPEKLEALIAFIDADVGYPLYKAISELKMRLSERPSADLHFSARGVTIAARVTRSDFEGWIARDLERIDQAVSAALAKAKVDEARVDKVFLTGGTSFVPAVRRRFEHRFGGDKIETGEQLLSIAYGLALIAESPDIARWTAQPGASETIDADDD